MMAQMVLITGGIVLLYPFGKTLLNVASQFISRMEASPPDPLPLQSVLFQIWLLMSGTFVLLGVTEAIPWRHALQGLLVGAWCLILAALDLARYWLPFRFTASMALAGAAWSLFIQPDRIPVQLLMEGLCTFGFLLLFRMVANRVSHEEGFGLGDVWLITALVMWFPLVSVTLVITLALLAALAVSVLTRQACLPFGPFLCLFAVLPALISLETLL